MLLRAWRYSLIMLLVLPGLVTAQVPAPAARYHRDLQKAAVSVWGLRAPVALFGAQIEKESTWKERARSYAGAAGLAQFMPGTANWISRLYRDRLGRAAPHSPGWAFMALALYNQRLYNQFPAATLCDRWAFTLAAYNGGDGGLRRDIAICRRASSCDASRWWGNVERYTWRGSRAKRENRGYPPQILRVLKPRYVAAGWADPENICR